MTRVDVPAVSAWDRITACADRLRRIEHRDAADDCVLVANRIVALEAEVARLRSPRPRQATPEQIAAAWRAFRGDRKGMLLGPGPAFVEAIGAALAVETAPRGEG